MSKSSFSIGRSIKYASISLYALAGVCFMIYTTQQSYTYAEGDEDLGYDISSVDASVTVGTACTLTGTVTAPHTATIANGINSTDIGTTVLNTTCNDSGGYALYAIGYTGDELGSTDLAYTSLDGTTTNSDYNIPTGTNTSGNTSNWSMKLSPVAGTTTATIENDYSSYNIVPDDYTLVATLNTVTDNANTSTPTGSSVSTTYQAYISPTQPAGTYTGKVKYTLVHPSTAPAPEKPVSIEAAFKASGATKTAQGYYKMQDMDPVINNAVNIVGDSLQVQDIRDNKIYWITKLADGNIWMTQNLDFNIVDGGANINSTNSDVPTNWADAGNLTNTYDNATNYSYSYTVSQSYDPGNLYWDGNVDTSYMGTLGNRTVTDPSATSGGTHYHIGNYYNWTAAVAMSDSSSYTSDQQDVNQSICPAGWRLPTYSGNRSYQNLVDIQGLTSGVNGNVQNNPAYFTYSGDLSYGVHQPITVGSYCSYWIGVVESSDDAYVFSFGAEDYIGQSDKSRTAGSPLRCVAR